MGEPVQRIRAHLSEVGADGALILSRPRIRWLSGFSGSNGFVLVTHAHAAVFTDARYTQQCAEQCADFDCHTLSGSLYAGLANYELGGKRLLLDPRITSMHAESQLRLHVPDTELLAVDGWVNTIVAEKRSDEVERIEASQRLNESVFEDVVAMITPGLTEREIAAEIVYRTLRAGAEAMAFDPIVASGPNGSLPHARPSNRELALGDVVLIDMGCYLGGYASDMTRVVSLGAPSTEFCDAYEVVRTAKNEAIRSARSGMPANELDAVARDVIEDAGYGEYFVHSLGHGLGTNIHEWPRIAASSEDMLPKRAVVTIEPGIYIPGKWGIRIEDIVVLSEHGCENLTWVHDGLREISA